MNRLLNDVTDARAGKDANEILAKKTPNRWMKNTRPYPYAIELVEGVAVTGTKMMTCITQENAPCLRCRKGVQSASVVEALYERQTQNQLNTVIKTNSMDPRCTFKHGTQLSIYIQSSIMHWYIRRWPHNASRAGAGWIGVGLLARPGPCREWACRVVS